MKGLVASTSAEQVAAESLLALASLPLASRSQDLVPPPGAAAGQAAASAMLPVAEPPVEEAQDQLPQWQEPLPG